MSVCRLPIYKVKMQSYITVKHTLHIEQKESKALTKVVGLSSNNSVNGRPRYAGL